MGEGEGGMIWENGIEICIISYMRRVASPGLMHDTGCLGLVHWDDPEGWYGEEEGSGWGTHVYLWQIHFDIWQNQYNIVKLNKIKFKKIAIVIFFSYNTGSYEKKVIYGDATSSLFLTAFKEF